MLASVRNVGNLNPSESHKELIRRNYEIGDYGF